MLGFGKKSKSISDIVKQFVTVRTELEAAITLSKGDIETSGNKVKSASESRDVLVKLAEDNLAKVVSLEETKVILQEDNIAEANSWLEQLPTNKLTKGEK